MKTTLLTVVLLGVISFAGAQNKSLPSPTSDLQTLPAGTYVIAMDNTLQTNAAGYFNLKSYGLVTYLLNNNVRLRWVITSGKSKDNIDFTGSAEDFLPAYVAGAVSRNFKAGPFVIYPADTVGVAARINTYYTSNSLIGANRPKVYRLSAAVPNVDIRYDMQGFKPKVIILNDGKNSDIHLDYMTLCGIPASTYTVGPATDLYSRCYTFASEPHNSDEYAATITAIKHFVEYGGNFLAQCAAVETYENSVYGRFHSTTGIQVVNTGIAPAATIYPNADLSFTQFEGAFDVALTGSVKNWRLATGSSFKNNEHNHTCGGTLGAQNPIGASVAKLTGAGLLGGMVFYLGNHKFEAINSIVEINGLRMYMNAMLTPVAINVGCSTGELLPYPLAVKLTDFKALLDEMANSVKLTWVTATESQSSHFTIERSLDGVNYTSTGVVLAKGNSNEQINYSFNDNISNIGSDVIYYRLKQTDIDGKNEWSQVRRVYPKGKLQDKAPTLTVYPNPAVSNLSIRIPAVWEGKKVAYEFLSMTGEVLRRTESAGTISVIVVNIENLQTGVYLVKATCENQVLYQKVIKK